MTTAPRLLAGALLALTACAAPGRAERIGTRPDGGTLMLSANSDKAWERAKELMNAQCGDAGYRILSQGPEQGRSRGGPPPATPGAMADPVGMAGAPYGIRVDYECKGGTSAVPAPPLQAPAPPEPRKTADPK